MLHKPTTIVRHTGKNSYLPHVQCQWYCSWFLRQPGYCWSHIGSISPDTRAPDKHPVQGGEDRLMKLLLSFKISKKCIEKKISCTFWYIKQPKLWEERGALTACLSVCETFLYNIWDAVYPLTALLTPYLHCLDCGPYWNRHCSSASCNCPGSSSEKWKSRWGGRSRRQSPAPELKKIKIEIRACWTAAVVICFCQVKHKIWMRFYYFIYSSYFLIFKTNKRSL